MSEAEKSDELVDDELVDDELEIEDYAFINNNLQALSSHRGERIKSLKAKLTLAVDLLTEAVETNIDKDKVWQEKARQALTGIKGSK